LVGSSGISKDLQSSLSGSLSSGKLDCGFFKLVVSLIPGFTSQTKVILGLGKVNLSLVKVVLSLAKSVFSLI
jgi:hypothetical protein